MTISKLVLLLLAGGLMSAQAPVPLASKSAPDNILACQSLDLYKRFADFDFSRNGVVLPWASGPMPQELSDNFGLLCTWLIDDPFPAPGNYHVEKTDNGYTCILAPWMGGPNSVATTCFWTTASKLRYIGRGPQLSDKQSAEVLKLDVESRMFRNVAQAYWRRVDELTYIDLDGKNEKRRVLTPVQKREIAELDYLADKAEHQGLELKTKAEQICADSSPLIEVRQGTFFVSTRMNGCEPTRYTAKNQSGQNDLVFNYSSRC